MLRRSALKRIVEDALIKGEGHADANETLAFTRQLENINQQMFQVGYAEAQALSVFAGLIKGDIDPTDEKATWRLFDRYGEAKFVSNYSDPRDFPQAQATGQEMSTYIKSLGASYTVTIQELRRAARLNQSLDSDRLSMAREMIERKIDSTVTSGDGTTGTNAVLGLFSSSYVTDYIQGTLATANGQTSWDLALDPANATDQTKRDLAASKICDDLNYLHTKAFVDSKQRVKLDSLVLDSKNWKLLTNTRLSTYSDVNIMTYVQGNTPFKSIQAWNRLDTAGSGSKARVLAFERNPLNFQIILPIPFEQFPPVAQALAFTTYCHARCGGVQVRFPKSIAYLDGTQST